MRRRSARSRRSRSPRSIRRSGICAASVAEPAALDSSPAAPRTAARSTRPKAAGCISTTQALVDDALAAQGQGLSRARRSRSAGRARPRTIAGSPAVRAALGDGYEIMTDANQGFSLDEAIRRAGAAAPSSISPGSRSRCRPTIRRPCQALPSSTTTPIAIGESLYSIRHFREYMAERRLLDRAGRCRAASAASRPG